jgi:hypothetical protein
MLRASPMRNAFSKLSEIFEMFIDDAVHDLPIDGFVVMNRDVSETH